MKHPYRAASPPPVAIERPSTTAPSPVHALLAASLAVIPLVLAAVICAH